MDKIMHFKSQQERLDFLNGGYEEIVPKVAEKKEKDAVTEEKPRKKASKPKKTTKKGAKEDEVSAE